MKMPTSITRSPRRHPDVESPARHDRRGGIGTRPCPYDSRDEKRRRKNLDFEKRRKIGPSLKGVKEIRIFVVVEVREEHKKLQVDNYGGKQTT